MRQNYSLRCIAIILIIVACPINLHGQARLYAENQLGISGVSGHAGTGNLKLLKNPVATGKGNMRKKVVIMLKVDVDSILTLNNPSETDILKYCTLSDNKNRTDSYPKTFLSNVYSGKRVKWKDSSANSGKIRIDSITLNSGEPILFRKGPTLKRKWLRLSGRVKKANELKKLDNMESLYTIHFKIKKDGKWYAPYKIDPKLKANN